MEIEKSQFAFNVDQVGIVVKDLQKSINYFASTFGIGPFHVFEAYVPDTVVRGKVSPSKTKFAFAQAGKVQIELIQNIEGENIYAEFLLNKGEGLHHVAMFVDDVDVEAAKLGKSGVEVLQRGSAGGMSWTYLDTEEIGGVIFELIPRPRHQ